MQASMDLLEVVAMHVWLVHTKPLAALNCVRRVPNREPSPTMPEQLVFRAARTKKKLIAYAIPVLRISSVLLHTLIVNATPVMQVQMLNPVMLV